MKCRHCSSPLSVTLINLGIAPHSNAYLCSETKNEKKYPLKVLVCTNCWLVQTEDHCKANELFTPDYAYFSSYSSSWLEHAKRYVEEMISRFGLDKSSRVVEVAANDGYLLQFVKKAGISCYGIEPTTCTASVARQKGIEIIEKFFGTDLAKYLAEEGKMADLMVGNNVLAHVPDINDFVSGFRILLKPNGVVTFEFPHLYQLVSQNLFDTIYHEHFSYLSLTAVNRIFEENGLSIFDVEELTTQGGSLRVFACRKDTGKFTRTNHIKKILDLEEKAGMKTVEYYVAFQQKADKVRDDFLDFLHQKKQEGKLIAGYGAAAKGNTLLNYAGIGPELIPFVADLNPQKQGKLLPGSHIPIVDEKYIRTQKPDFVIILPWNLKNEIIVQLSYIREWGGQFVTAIPKLEIIE